MKRLLSFLTVIAFLLSSTAFASVGYKKDGAPTGNAANIDFESCYTSFDGSTVTFYGNGYAGGVSEVTGASGLGAAALAYGILVIPEIGALDASGNRYTSLSAGTAGQIITIVLEVTGGTMYITDDKLSATLQAAVVETGWDDIKLDDATDSITLLYVDSTYGWVIIGNNGCDIT